MFVLILISIGQGNPESLTIIGVNDSFFLIIGLKYENSKNIICRI